MRESKLPAQIRERLRQEAEYWDEKVRKESPKEVAILLEEAQLFKAARPPKQPVSVRMDPEDIAKAKRIARRKGLSCSQLLSMWLHEKIEKEVNRDT